MRERGRDWTDNGSAKTDKSKGGFVALEYMEVGKKCSSACAMTTTIPFVVNVIRELSCTTNNSTWREIIFHYRSFQKQFQIERGRLFDRSVNKKKKNMGEEGYARTWFIWSIFDQKTELFSCCMKYLIIFFETPWK